nr:DEAD/DEAH box helicase [Methanocalculus sp. AMF5]
MVSTLRWDEFRSVQEEALLAYGREMDLLILAPTAGGKTESAFLPALHDLLTARTPGIGILYLSPAKALINDQYLRITHITAPLGLEVSAWHGDVQRSDRIWHEDEPPHILLTTPESLELLLMDPKRRRAFLQLRSVIVDEVHTFAGSARGVQLRCLIERLDHLCTRRIQRIALSATVGNPEALLAWFSGHDRTGACIRAESPPSARRFSFLIEASEDERIRLLAGVVANKKTLLFTGSRSEAERVHAALSQYVASALVHHSAVSPDARRAAEEEMAGSGPACIVCTSTLELGIDIGALDLVVQYGPPDSVASFLQRLGRSGRRKRPPEMVFLLANGEEALLAAAAVRAAREKLVEPEAPPAIPCHVFLQQLFVQLAISRRGLGRRPLISGLLALPPFNGISKEDADRILDHLFSEGYLAMDGDLVTLGSSAERELFRYHGLPLCSVIPDIRGYRATTPEGEFVGTLDPLFAGSAAHGFTLAGRSWRVLARDDERRSLLVVPMQREASRPFWTGGGRHGISHLLAGAAGRIARQREPDLPLAEEVQDAIRDAVSTWPAGCECDEIVILAEPMAEGSWVSAWTFLGDHLNATLACLLRYLLPSNWAVESSFSSVTVAVPGFVEPAAGEEAVSVALLQIRDLSIDELAAMLPELPPDTWRLGSYLPRAIRQRMAAVDSYHLPSVIAALQDRYHPCF